ncbi:isocitrate lyase/phosphoenolpyruvate mutase family protein [Arthrobacter psychrolactophilus]
MTSFRELHFQDSPFLLPNSWDVGSALAFVAAGYPAIGTTSFGIASSTGMPDGGRASKTATSALAVQLTRLPVHITTDIEDGYSDDPDEVADYVAELSRAGVAGVNIEDSRDGHLVDPATLAAKIVEIKQRCPVNCNFKLTGGCSLF